MQWNWRIVAYSGVMCAVLSCCGIIGGIVGDRNALYLAFGGVIGVISTAMAVTIDYLERRRRK
jgi:NhaP-type Na+/H+ or K+/H+ antiporter